MDMLGYTIIEPVHKVRETEYDEAFYRLPDDLITWGLPRCAVGSFTTWAGETRTPRARPRISRG